MVDLFSASSLWVVLIIIDCLLFIRLGLLFRQDKDYRKLMFIIGLLFIMLIYFIALLGIESSHFTKRIFDWCSLPILSAFTLNALIDSKKSRQLNSFKIFIGITCLTTALFFFPIPFSSLYLLVPLLAIALFTTLYSLKKEFDIAIITLILSLPSFTVCYFALYENNFYLAIFAAFMAKAFLLLSFEIGRKKFGTNSFFVLQKELSGTKAKMDALQQKLIISERLATIGQLSTILAHDLRNPLQAMSTGIFSLKRSSEISNNAQLQGMVNHMGEAVQYSERIIQALLDYSENVNVDISDFNPKLVIEKTLTTISIPDKIRVINNTKDTPQIQGDMSKLTQAFKNIIENAFDAMPSGGTLKITNNELNNDVEFSFEDSGVGISSEDIEKIGTPFFTTKAKGIGLGLANCRKIIDAHGGELQVCSTPAEGTLFTIKIPKKAKQGLPAWEKYNIFSTGALTKEEISVNL
jgi:signal transduction histidine kinase